MHAARRQAGMSLIEIAVVVAIVGVMATIAVPSFQNWSSDQRAKAAVREIGDLYSVARLEAIRTGVTHAVFIWEDPSNNPLMVGAARVAALAIRDDDGDGLPDASEQIAFVPLDPSGQLAWGVTFATGVGAAPSDPDPNGKFTTGFTFRDPDGNDSSWVSFRPDGLPRGFKVGPYDDGGAAGIGGGGGGVYVTNSERDYAVVLQPMGTVRVHPFDRSTATWRN